MKNRWGGVRHTFEEHLQEWGSLATQLGHMPSKVEAEEAGLASPCWLTDQRNYAKRGRHIKENPALLELRISQMVETLGANWAAVRVAPRWSTEDEQLLRELVEEEGAGNWEAKAEKFKGRTWNQLRCKWNQQLCKRPAAAAPKGRVTKRRRRGSAQ